MLVHVFPAACPQRRFAGATGLFKPLGIAIAALVCGCSSSNELTTTATTLRAEVPIITPQPETKETQEKGGLQISIAPVSYSATRQDSVMIEPRNPPSMVVMTGAPADSVYVQRTTKPALAVSPDRLRFLVKINNKMPRVFRGQGTVVQFNVGGRLQAMDQMGYNNFLGAIVPPRQEQQIEIVGPTLANLTDKKGILGVFLYDVVTNQNEAGVVTEKQNYEWYFDYRLEPQEVQTEAKTERLWIPFSEYQQEMTRQQMEAAKKMYPTAPMQAYPGQPYVNPEYPARTP